MERDVHRDPSKWDLLQRVRPPQPRVKGQDAALHSFKAMKEDAVCGLQAFMKSWGWGMEEEDAGGGKNRSEKTGEGIVRRQKDGGERKPEKGIEPERGAGAVSPVRDPGPPASGNGSSAPAASPGMAWTCACRYLCLSVPLSVNALGVASTATAPLLGGGGTRK